MATGGVLPRVVDTLMRHSRTAASSNAENGVSSLDIVKTAVPLIWSAFARQAYGRPGKRNTKKSERKMFSAIKTTLILLWSLCSNPSNMVTFGLRILVATTTGRAVGWLVVIGAPKDNAGIQAVEFGVTLICSAVLAILATIVTLDEVGAHSDRKRLDISHLLTEPKTKTQPGVQNDT